MSFPNLPVTCPFLLTLAAAVLLPLLVPRGSVQAEESLDSLAWRVFQKAWYTETGLRQLAEAIALYQQAAEQAQASGDRDMAARAYVQVARCYEKLQKKQEAIQAYQNAFLISPAEHRDPNEIIRNLERPAEQLVFLGEIPEPNLKALSDYFYTEAEKVQIENPEKAIELYRQAIRFSKFLGQLERAAYANSFIGDLYRRLERYDEAMAAYREVQREFSQEIAVLAWCPIRIAETYRLVGRTAEAISAYRELDAPLFEKQVQQKLWAKLWLGDTLRCAGELDSAHTTWSEIRSLQPEAPLPAQLAAFLLGEQALTVPEEPADPFSNDAAYFAAVRFELGRDSEGAAKAYQQCVRLSQGYDWPRQLAASALQRVGPASESPGQETVPTSTDAPKP